MLESPFSFVTDRWAVIVIESKSCLLAGFVHFFPITVTRDIVMWRTMSSRRSKHHKKAILELGCLMPHSGLWATLYPNHLNRFEFFILSYLLGSPLSQPFSGHVSHFAKFFSWVGDHPEMVLYF